MRWLHRPGLLPLQLRLGRQGRRFLQERHGNGLLLCCRDVHRRAPLRCRPQSDRRHRVCAAEERNGRGDRLHPGQGRPGERRRHHPGSGQRRRGQTVPRDQHSHARVLLKGTLRKINAGRKRRIHRPLCLHWSQHQGTGAQRQDGERARRVVLHHTHQQAHHRRFRQEHRLQGFRSERLVRDYLQERGLRGGRPSLLHVYEPGLRRVAQPHHQDWQVGIYWSQLPHGARLQAPRRGRLESLPELPVCRKYLHRSQDAEAHCPRCL